MKCAGFWARFCASLVDGIIIQIVSILIGFAIGIILGITLGASDETENLAKGFGGLAGIIFVWLYYASMESSNQQATLGKQALGIKVADLNGKPISFGRATGRHFAKYISLLTLLIGYIMAAFTKKKQALHDMIAGTLVVRGK